MTMNAGASVCGIYECETCEYLSSARCPGCAPGNAQVAQSGGHPCRVYECVRSRSIAACADCEEPACSLRRAAELICPLRSRFEKPRWWAGRMARSLESRGAGTVAARGAKRSPKVITRLRWYLTALDSFAAEGRQAVSSWQLAERVGVSSALVRKDLSKFGDFGTPSLGYEVEFLREKLRSILCRGKPPDIIWIGARALRLSENTLGGLAKHNCRLCGVFDDEHDEIGAKIGDLVVMPVSRLREELNGEPPAVAVLAVDGFQAHCVASLLVDIGVRAILNLSGELLVVPPHVHVANFDLIGELLELCYYCA